MTDAELSALARAATPDEDWFKTDGALVRFGINPNDVAHLAAWSPARALAALSVIEAARKCEVGKWNLHAALAAWDALNEETKP